MRKRVYRAGMIPFFRKENGDIVMNFMVPTDTEYSGDKPQFCKGRVEDGENHEDAAVREAHEELGLKESNVKWFYYMGQYLGYTHMYICEVENMEDFDDPHYETDYTVWLTLPEFEEKGRELHRPVIREAYNEFLIMSEDDIGGELEDLIHETDIDKDRV